LREREGAYHPWLRIYIFLVRNNEIFPQYNKMENRRGCSRFKMLVFEYVVDLFCMVNLDKTITGWTS
jgi:hypothetical protein